MPINSPQHVPLATNQSVGQMSYGRDLGPGQNPHVNFEPSITGGLREGQYQTEDIEGPELAGRLTRARIPRTNDYLQAGQRYQLLEPWEKDDLVLNFTTLISQADRKVQERMLWHFYMADDELGSRVSEGLGIGLDDVKDLGPLASQTLTEAEQERMKNLGKNGLRDVQGLAMTHCVPNGRVTVER
ncbi:catalase-related domain-containing protein [Arthrobacter sp. UYEF20]|uniref:catalase-related domain-containing protein n=1 Tax=Arthrobacter sp. UYEF20 TaxID=1756363 RepID=UPI0033958425